MKLRTIFVIAALASLLGVRAQKLTVESMKALPMDLSASQYERKDLAGKPCALVKVQLAATGAQFEGNVIGKVDYKTNEYWVYMSEGSYMLSIKHPSFVTLSVNFRDYGINGVQGKATYQLTVLMPQEGGVVQTQKLIINYSPISAMVLIDSKLYKGNGHIETKLPVGTHQYIIAADGYATAEATVKLTSEAPRTVTEYLVAIQQAPDQPSVQEEQPVVQQPAPPVVQQTITQTPVTTSPSTSGGQMETITVKGVSFNMIRVEGGTFQMGSNDSDAYSDEKPVHQVTLSTYYMGETEVTQALWEAVMGSNPSRFKGSQKPVEMVSWNDCQDFIQKLNAATGKQFRLPTEAEWEYAARGGMKIRGYMYSGSNRIDDVAVYFENSYKKGKKSPDYGTHNVKSKQANELGLYDMSGNVWEWCQDWKGDYSSSSQTNPTGPSTGSNRVSRGGSWRVNAGDCRVSYRYSYLPTDTFINLGLRLALQ